MPAHAIIELRDVDVSTDASTLIRRLSMDIAPGRVLALVSEQPEVRRALGRVLRGDTDGYVVAGDLVMDGRELVSRVGGGTQAEMYVAGVDGPLDTRSRLHDVASIDALERVQLHDANARVSSLDESGRLRAAFAQALQRHPKLVVVDVPYQAQSGSLYPTYSSLLHSLARDPSTAFVVCTDSLAVAADVADDVVVMLDGRAVEWGSVYDICLRPAMPYVQDLVRLTPSPHRAMPDFSGLVDLTAHQGCPWVLNCREAVVHACSQAFPAMRDVSLGHVAACHLLGVPHGA